MTVVIKKCVAQIPVFVVDWPSSCKPFYARESSSPGVVEAADLLLPSVGELRGGSLREHRCADIVHNSDLNMLYGVIFARADVLERRISECFGGSTPEQCGLQWSV